MFLISTVFHHFHYRLTHRGSKTLDSGSIWLKSRVWEQLDVSPCKYPTFPSGSTAGGCRNFISSFASNPQFKVKLTDSDDDADDLCTCLVSLLQKGSRKRKAEGTGGDGGCLTIGK